MGHVHDKTIASMTARTRAVPVFWVVLGMLILIVLGICFPSSVSIAATSPTSTPTIISPSSPVVFVIPRTTKYMFSNNDPESKATDLLTSLGVPHELQTVTTGLGGLTVTENLPLIAGINDIAGAVYDPSTKRLLFVGTHNPALPDITPADFVVALRLVYAEGPDPAVSIDPIDPTKLGGMMKASYYGDIANTHFGQVMFEADRYLKNIDAGQDNITGKPMTPKVEGYKSELDLSLQFHSATQEQRWHRMWYLLKSKELPVRVNADGHSMLFGEVPIVIEARFVTFDSQGKKHDIPGSDPAVDAFVNHFNTHFADFAKDKAEVGQLVQLAKLLAMARWLRSNSIPIDSSSFGLYPVSQDTPTTTPGQIVSKSQTSSDGKSLWTYTVTLFGGVDFGFDIKPEVAPSTDLVYQLDAIGDTIPLDQHGYVANATLGDKMVQVAPLALGRAEVSGGLSFSSKLLSTASAGDLPLDLAVHYNSLSSDVSPIGVGWTLEEQRLSFPDQAKRYVINGKPVELQDTVTVMDLETGQARNYRNAMKVVNGNQVVYEPVDGEGPTLYFNITENYYAVKYGEVENRFSRDGLLQAQIKGNERVDFRRDASNNITAIEDSRGGSLKLTYAEGHLVGVIGSDGQETKLIYDGDNLTKIQRPEGTTSIVYFEGRPVELTDENGTQRFETDDIGRVLRLETGGIVRESYYLPGGRSMDIYTGVANRKITVTRDSHGRITDIAVEEQVITADAQAAHTALGSAASQSRSVASVLLENPKADVSWLLAGNYQQLTVESEGRPVIQAQGNRLSVEGRINWDRLQADWKTNSARLEQLRQQGVTEPMLDPDSGAVGGVNATTGETVVLVPNAKGEFVRRSYQALRPVREDLAQLITDLGAQARGVQVTGIFATPKGGWVSLSPSGEVNPFLTGSESVLKDLRQSIQSGDGERARRLAEQVAEPFNRDLGNILQIQWQIKSATNAKDLIAEAYPITRELFKSGVPDSVVRQIQGTIRPGQTIQLKPLQTAYGLLLPEQGKTLFLDVPPAVRYLMTYHLGIDNIRAIGSDSTPWRANDSLSQEKPITRQQIAIAFSPSSTATKAEAEAERQAFLPIRTQFEKLEVSVIDLGGDPAANKRVLDELARDGMVVFQIVHSDPAGGMYVHDDGSVQLSDLQVARGAKTMFTCCGLQNGIADAIVRAGAYSVSSVSEPITPAEVNAILARLGNILEQHPNGILPSQLERELRIRTRIDMGGPGLLPELLPLSERLDSMSKSLNG